MPSRKTYDPTHPRCIYPRFGATVDSALRDIGMSASELSRKLGVDASSVRGYRRGFQRISASRVKDLEFHLGVRIDMSESTPTERRETKSDIIKAFARKNNIEIIDVPLSLGNDDVMLVVRDGALNM